jgi:hypothetical protein
MLETIREFARQQLDESGEAELIRRQHAQFFLALAEAAGPEMWGSRQPEYLEQLEQEHDNLRATLDWCLESGEAEAGLRIGGAVWRFWFIRGYMAEGRDRLESLLSRPEASLSTRARAKALDGAGVLALNGTPMDNKEITRQRAPTLKSSGPWHRSRSGISSGPATTGSTAWGSWPATRVSW